MLRDALKIGLGFLVLATVMEAAPKRPDWVDQIPKAPLLFQGIGLANDTGSPEDDRLRADQDARTQIIQEISTTLSAEISSYYRETSKKNDYTVSDGVEVFSSLSSAYAEGTIEGIQIVDRYYDRKRQVYYSYATLKRSEFQTQMTRRADEARDYAQEKLDYAMASYQEGDISTSMFQLSQALEHVVVAQSIVKRHLEGDLNNDGKTEFLDAALSRMLSQVGNMLEFKSLSGDGQKGERNQGLEQPLRGSVHYVGGELPVPVPNLPLRVFINGSEADYVPHIRTNAEGVFEARIDKIISASSSSPTVIVALDLPTLDAYYSHSGLNSAEILPMGSEFHFSMDIAASVTFFVHLMEDVNGNFDSRPKSTGVLIKALLSEEYKVLDQRRVSDKISKEDLEFNIEYDNFNQLAELLTPVADYAIIGLTSSETSSTGTLNYARASSRITALDLETGRVIASGLQENVKSAGNTEEKANSTAIRKASNGAIADLLSQLEQALK